MDSNLFGESVPPERQQGKCAHLNADYRLSCQASIDVHSRYEIGQDAVYADEPKVMWTGLVQVTCLDCGKVLYYTGSNMPKFLRRRLSRLKNLPDYVDMGEYLK